MEAVSGKGSASMDLRAYQLTWISTGCQATDGNGSRSSRSSSNSNGFAATVLDKICQARSVSHWRLR